MSIFTRIRRSIDGNPHLVIECVLALALIIFGLYVASPWYVVTASNALGAIADTQISRSILGGLYLVPALMTLIGFKRKHLRKWGAFGMFCAYLFAVLLRLLTVGFFPFIWLFMFALSLIAGTLYIYESRHEAEADG